MMMKYLMLMLLIAWSALEIKGQSHAIKGRAIATPVAFVYAVGIGYEYSLKNGFSAQMLLNRTGFDWDNKDGGSGHKNSIVPEVRYYFNKGEGFNKNLFLGGFLELANKYSLPSGDQFIEFNADGTRETYFTGSKRTSKSPGVIIGYLLQFKNSLFLEGYLGVRYNYTKIIRSYNDNGLQLEEIDYSNQTGMRMGFNLGYRF